MPLQKKFFEKKYHWSETTLMPVFVKINKNIKAKTLKNACQLIIEQHDALRARFMRCRGQWQQKILANDPVCFHNYSILSNRKKDIKKQIQKISTEESSTFTLENGPLIKFILIDIEKQSSQYLIIAAHHLVCDWSSLQLILQELEFFYNKLYSKKDVGQYIQSDSFVAQAKRYQKMANKTVDLEKITFWIKNLNNSFICIPQDYATDLKNNIEANVRKFSVKLEHNIFLSLIKKLQNHKDITLYDILLTGAIIVLNSYTKNNYQLLDLRHHGRIDTEDDSIDLTRSVGWFTIVYPIKLSLLPNEDNLLKKVISIKQQLDSVPNQGLDYGLAKYFPQEKNLKKSLEALPTAPISFNYLGNFKTITEGNTSLFQLSDHYLLEITSKSKAKKNHIFDINVKVQDDECYILWGYRKHFHKERTIQKLLEQYLLFLKNLVKFL